MTDPTELIIERLGPRGDGIAQVGGETFYVAGALPGERVRVRPGQKRGDGRAADLLDLVEASPLRQAPPCPHFADCGGCSVQHLADAPYADWKRDLVVQALERRGFDPALVAPLVRTGPAGRRRAELAAFRLPTGNRVILGFHARASRRIVDVETCLILRPALLALLPALRQSLQDVLPKRGTADILLTETDRGLDLLVSADRPPRPAQTLALSRLAESEGFPRVSWRSKQGIEPVALREAPAVAVSGFPVEIPPGAFLQASVEAEDMMVSRVRAALADAGPGSVPVADLYCGVGTFSLPLAADGKRVAAFDGDAPAVDALRRAAGGAGFGGSVTPQARDLARRPLSPDELKGYQAVVFDPPRAGAAEQAAALAKSVVPRVVAVSCNPATFARDASLLAEGGYRLEGVTPIDQFVWSGHVELVAAFSR